MDESITIIVAIIFIVFAIIQIIFFFKMWIMTNNVKKILDILNSKDNREVKLPKKAKVKGLDNELEVLYMENGKVLCNIKGDYGKNYKYFKFEDLIFE